MNYNSIDPTCAFYNSIVFKEIMGKDYDAFKETQKGKQSDHE